MFILNEDNSIYVTRGDIATISVSLTDNDGNPYMFIPGDVLRIKVFEKKNCSEVVLQKDFPVDEETDTVELYLDERDTKIGGVISKPVDYWYEIELNPFSDPQTVIGYDEDGAKVFKLFPEGRDLEEHEYTEEEIPFMDDELDLTSTRPIENQAVARAVVQLRTALNKTDAKSAETATELSLERERINNLISHNVTALTQNLGYLESISDETKAKIDGVINSDGVFATIKVNWREANQIYGGTTFSVFIIPAECRPIDVGVIHTEDGLEYSIGYDTTNKRYYLSATAQSGVVVAPSGACEVTMTYELGEYELKDIRVGADGRTYRNAGEAVRTQFNNIPITMDKTVNLCDQIPHCGIRLVSSGTQLMGVVSDNVPSTKCKTMIIEVEPNTTYSVIRELTTAYFAVSSSSEKYLWADLLTYPNYMATPKNMKCYGAVADNTTKHFSFTTDEHAKYLYITYTLNYEDSYIQVIEGKYEDFTIDITDKPVFYWMEKLNVYRKPEIDKTVNKIYPNKYISKDSKIITVCVGKAKYYLYFVNNEKINASIWRCYRAEILGEDNRYHLLWDGSDADGVVQIANEADFVGGFHGDEQLLSMKLFIDGVEITDEVFDIREFKRVDIYVESVLYHCSESINNNSVTFNRFKTISFYDDVMEIQNKLVAAKDLNIAVCYLGMLSVNRFDNDGVTTMLNGYHTDSDCQFKNDATAATESLKQVVMHTIHGDVCITAKNMSDQKYKGSVASYSASAENNRLKVYLAPIMANNNSPVTIRENEVLKGGYVLKI